MVYLANNRRRHLSGGSVGPVVPVGGVWQDFDLSKLSSPVNSAQLYDNGASYYNNRPIRCYGVAPMPDGSLLLNAHQQGHAYVWGFADGHSFDLSQINSKYTCKSPAQSSFYGVALFPDGLGMYLRYSGATIYYRHLGYAYDLNSVVAADNAVPFNGSGQGVMTQPHYLEPSSDGTMLIYKGNNDSVVWTLEVDPAWPTIPDGRVWRLSYMNLTVFNDEVKDATGMSSAPSYNAVAFSPDGLVMMVTTNTAVLKFCLTTPWTPRTAVFHSGANLRTAVGDSNSSFAGVAVNSAGTKMVIHNRSNSETSAHVKFHEFDLVT